MSYLGRSAKLSLKAQEKVSFLATAGQTVKTGLSYTPSFIEVYVNGVLLTDTTDFTATNGNSVTFTVALLLNDEVTVISLKTFTVADHYTKSDADTLLAAKSTVASPVFTGNVGVGVTTEAWDSQWAALQIGGLSSYISPIAANVNQALMINNNAYYDGSWKYQITDESSSYYQLHGAHTFRVAASGDADSAISWTNAMTIDNAGIVTKPYQPAFGARATTTNIPITTQTTVTLTERFDVGGNLASNVFTAPVTGKYLITYMFYFSNVDSAHTTLDVTLVTSNKVYQQTFKPSVILSADGNFSVSSSSVCDMDAGDTAYIRVYVATGTAQTDIHGDSTASCYLLG